MAKAQGQGRNSQGSRGRPRRAALVRSARHRQARDAGEAISRMKYVLCVRNDEYPAALEVGKAYSAIMGRRLDRLAARAGFIRVVDESGEDYLYPKEFFAALPKGLQTLIAKAKKTSRPARQ